MGSNLVFGFVYYSSPSATTEFNQDLCFKPTQHFWWHLSHQNPEKLFLQFTSSSFCNERPEYLNTSTGKGDLQQPLLWPRQNSKYAAHLFSPQFPIQNEGFPLLCTCSRYDTQFHPNPRHNSSVYPTIKNYLRYSLVSAVSFLEMLNIPQNHCRTDTWLG